MPHDIQECLCLGKLSFLFCFWQMLTIFHFPASSCQLANWSSSTFSSQQNKTLPFKENMQCCPAGCYTIFHIANPTPKDFGVNTFAENLLKLGFWGCGIARAKMITLSMAAPTIWCAFPAQAQAQKVFPKNGRAFLLASLGPEIYFSLAKP